MATEEFKPTDRFYRIIECDYRLMQVVARFNITMGFGDKTVSEVCHMHNVDVHTFLAVINQVVYDLAASSKKVSLDLVNMGALLDYLKRTHAYLVDHQLPRMRKTLFTAMDCSLQNEVAFLLVKYFDMYVAEVQAHVAQEEQEVFAYAESLMEGSLSPDPLLEGKGSHKHNADFVAKLHELIQMFLQYYPQEGINEELNDVVYNLYRIEEDIRIHCKLEDEMLLPLVRKLERRRMSQHQHMDGGNKVATSDNASKMLSDREQAIAVCVAKGLSNKEIADQLNISFNTVTTHRRNIARKLNIHSSAGIAIFCVVNKLVKLEEIKL
jgi:regulator of cell morphogenesis and NO signaling